MEVRKRIAATVVLILFIFLLCFLIMAFSVSNALRLKDIKNQSTELLLNLYRLYFELKSVLFATSYTTREIRESLEARIGEFEAVLTALVREAPAAMRSRELSERSASALRLWENSRRSLQPVLATLDGLIQSGLDGRTGLMVSRLHYGQHLSGSRLTDTLDHFHLVSLENNIETATAAASSYNAVITAFTGEVRQEADAFIAISFIVAALLVASAAGGAVVFTLLYGRQALVRQVERLLQETVVKEQEKRSAQIAALQYQINPHFLFNTLASIRAAALGGEETDQTAEMLLSLSRYLRNVFRDTAALVSLETELSNIREYLRIHQLRFRDRLAVEFEIPAAALAAGMPPFLIQPIVENAILHGLSRRLNQPDGGAHLLISARVHGVVLDLEIEDNGEGMSETLAASVLHEDRRPDGVRLHIGLKNINDRIHLKFGPPFGLIIRSKPGAWTRVRLHLPLLPADGTAHA
jgi:hypothetical protein